MRKILIAVLIIIILMMFATPAFFIVWF